MSAGPTTVCVDVTVFAGPYDSLAVPEIGLRSEYSQLGHHGNGLESSKGMYQ